METKSPLDGPMDELSIKKTCTNEVKKNNGDECTGFKEKENKEFDLLNSVLVLAAILTFVYMVLLRH
jgi:hypothetical protein